MNWFRKIFPREPALEDAADDHIIVHPGAPGRAARTASDLPSFRRAGALVPGGGEIDDARAKVSVAFTPSQPVNNREMFAGRRQILQNLVTAIEDQRLHFVLYGDRGIGKTSILHMIKDLAGEADYLVVYVSCGDRMTFSDFARRVAQRIPLLFHGGYAPGSPEIEEEKTLADILPAGEIDVATFSEQLERLTEARLLMLLDEFDRVETDGFRRSIAELIKNLSDRAAPAQIIIAGVASNLPQLIAHIPSIRRNIVGVQVPNMDEAEVAEMLDLAERRAKITFHPDARELAELATLGLPYLVGLIGQRAALTAVQDERLEINKADIRDAVRAARGDLAGRLDTRTLYAVMKAEHENNLSAYSQIAHIALKAGGIIPSATVENLLGSLPAATSDGALIAPMEGDQFGRWHFVDDGAAPFIWLSALGAD